MNKIFLIIIMISIIIVPTFGLITVSGPPSLSVDESTAQTQNQQAVIEDLPLDQVIDSNPSVQTQPIVTNNPITVPESPISPDGSVTDYGTNELIQQNTEITPNPIEVPESIPYPENEFSSDTTYSSIPPTETTSSESIMVEVISLRYEINELKNKLNSNDVTTQEYALNLQKVSDTLNEFQKEVEHYRELQPSIEAAMSPISPLLYIAIYFGLFLALVSVSIGSFILYKGGYITSLFDASKNNHDLQKVIQAKKFVSTMRNRSFSDKEIEQELYHFGYDKTIVDAAMKN